MAATLEAESTLTDRYQTTVPEPIRQALRLGKRDKIRYELKDGNVVISRAEAVVEADPVTRGACAEGRGTEEASSESL